MATQRNDEIDLLELLINCIKFFKKSFWLLTIFFLVGGLLGFLKVQISKPYYEMTITATSSVDIDLTVDVINSMQEKLKTHPSGGIDFKKVEATRFKNNYKDINNSLERIKIIAQYYKVPDIISLKDNFKYYVENNYFIKTSIELQQKQSIELITKIEKEITELDNLQAAFLNNQISHKNEALMINENSDSYDQMVFLYEKKHRLEQQLLLSGFQIIDNSTPIISKKVNLYISIVIGGLCLSFIGFIFLIGKKFNQKYLKS